MGREEAADGGNTLSFRIHAVKRMAGMPPYRSIPADGVGSMKTGAICYWIFSASKICRLYSINSCEAVKRVVRGRGCRIVSSCVIRPGAPDMI